MKPIKVIIPANEDISFVESEKKYSLPTDALSLGSWNCYSLKGVYLPKAIKYCLRSGNAIVALQDTDHDFSRVDNSKFEIIAVKRENPVESFNFPLDSSPWKDLGETIIEIPRFQSSNLTTGTVGAEAGCQEENDAEESKQNSSSKAKKSGKKAKQVAGNTIDESEKKLNSDYGMAFFVRKNVGIEVVDVVSLHPRIAYIKFKFNDVATCLVNVYAPATGEFSPKIGKNFFGILEQKYSELRNNFNGYLILCGDMNACPKYSETGLHYPWIDKHVYGSNNIHGEAFLEFLHLTNLHVINSRFPRDKEKMWTYQQATKTEIDFFLSDNLDDIEEVNVVRKRKGERTNDHRMISSVWRVSKEREERRKELIEVKSFWQKWRENTEIMEQSKKKKEIDIKLNNLKNNKNASHGVLLHTFMKKEKDEEIHVPIEQEICLLKKHLKNINWIDDQKSFEKGKPSLLESPITEEILESPITEEEVCSEFLKLDHYSFQKIGECNVNANGIALLTVSEITNLFNAELEQHYSSSHVSNEDVPDWRKVTFHLPLQTANYKSLEEYTFQGMRALLGQLYSNILARRLNNKLAGYINEGKYDKTESIEIQREKKRIQNIFAITLLFEKFNGNNKPIFISFVRFKNAVNTVKVSSVLKSLEAADKHLIHAVASLLVDNGAKVKVGETIIKVEKNRGIHLGEMASNLLLSAVLKMIVNECGIVENADEKHTKVIPSEDQIVLIAADIKKSEENFGKLVETSKLHGLDVDYNELVLIRSHPSGQSDYFFYNCEKIKPRPKNFDPQLVNYFNRFINTNNGLTAELLRNKALVENELRTFDTADEEKNHAFFKETLVPLFFFACETWKPTPREFGKIEEYVQNFKKTLKIEEHAFNTQNYVLYRQALFIKHLRNGGDTYCSTLLSMGGGPSSPLRHWGYKVVNNFKNFMKEKNQLEKLKIEGNRKKLSIRGLIEFINNNENVWGKFIEKCEENIENL